jgi:methionine synthase II (cobalamin-independent)
MIDNKTHSVLFELQKNLEDLSSAKEQMEEFRTSSLEVVLGIGDVKTKYIEHLEKIKSDYEKRVANLDKKMNYFLAENQDENKKTIQKIVSTSEEIISKGIEKFEVVSNKVETSNNEKIETIKNLLEHYKNVVKASNSLIDTLTAIDFPTKLDVLSSKTQLINESITSAKQALEIKLNESQNLIIEKTMTTKEQILQNTENKYNALADTINASEFKVKDCLKVFSDSLNDLSEMKFKQVYEHLEKQDKEIKTQKFLLLAITMITIGGIILNFILK